MGSEFESRATHKQRPVGVAVISPGSQLGERQFKSGTGHGAVGKAGEGHQPFKLGIAGSTPACVTADVVEWLPRRAHNPEGRFESDIRNEGWPRARAELDGEARRSFLRSSTGRATGR